MFCGQGRPTSLSVSSPRRYNGPTGDWTNVERRIPSRSLSRGFLGSGSSPKRGVEQPAEDDCLASMGDVRVITQRGKMNATGLWAQYRDELVNDPLLVLGLTAALVALATTPIAFRDPGTAGLVQGPAGAGLAAPGVLVDRRRHDAGDGHPGDLRRAGAQEPVVRQEPLRVRPEQDVVRAGAGQGIRDCAAGRRGRQAGDGAAGAGAEEPGR